MEDTNDTTTMPGAHLLPTTPEQVDQLHAQLDALRYALQAAGLEAKGGPLRLVEQAKSFLEREAQKTAKKPLRRKPRVGALSAREIAMLREKQIDPSKYIAAKNARRGRK
jgi:membrane-bound lytic murein transglycosylase MltF